MEVTNRPPYSTSSEKTIPSQVENEVAIQDRSPEGFHPYLHVLKKRKGTLAIAFIACLAIAFYINVSQSPVYRASVEVVIEPKNIRNALKPGLMSQALRDPTLLMTQFRLIGGPKVAQRIAELLNNRVEERQAIREAYGLKVGKGEDPGAAFNESEKESLARAIRGSVAARQVASGVRILEIYVHGTVPVLTKILVDAAAEAYIQINHESHIASFKKNFSMISKSLTEIRSKMKVSDLAFKKIDSEVQLLEALEIFGERYPKVIQLRKEVPELTKELERNMANLLETKIGQREDLVPILLESHTDLESLSAISRDLYNLRPLVEQEGETNREMYNTIFKRLQELELAGGGGSVWFDAEVIEPATVPGSPVRPNKKLNVILGIIIGLFLGIGLSYFQEYMDNSIRSLEDIQTYLKLFPLGMVPHIQIEGATGGKNAKRGMKSGHVPRKYWNMSDPRIPLYTAEAYRIVRTNLAFGSLDTALKVIQVTSTVKGEGKSTTTTNLGISFAQTGMKVLLVDADMRRPSLHHILGLEGVRHGLHDLIAEGRTFDSVVEPTKIPGLFCLAAGMIPPNPAELLSSRRMKSLVQEIGKHFDIVLIDSPPVISVADASIIATHVNGTILVCRSGCIPRHMILQAKKTLEAVKGRVIGCVLNDVLSEHHPYYYDRYGKDDYYYGHENDLRQKEGQPLKQMTGFEKIKVMKEPAMAFISENWQRFTKKNQDQRFKDSDGYS